MIWLFVAIAIISFVLGFSAAASMHRSITHDIIDHLRDEYQIMDMGESLMRLRHKLIRKHLKEDKERLN